MKSDYFKIKQIQLGYNLPKKIVEKAKLQSVRVYTTLDNFFIFTDYPGYDPEIVGTGNGNGVDQGAYPSMRRLMFGVNVSF